MPRPLIGVTSNFKIAGDPPREQTCVSAAYLDAVLAAGGLPLPLPVPPAHDAALLDELLDRVAGLVFTGGFDPTAARFGQAQHPATRPVHPRREGYEFDLFARADQRRVPILGICLGHQIAHIGRGGAIVQHIERDGDDVAVVHYEHDDSSAWHEVDVRDARLAEILGHSRVRVCSRHHQVVPPERVGHDLTTAAVSADGYVEASADFRDGRFLVSVQWHPEDQPDQPEMLNLFKALVEAASQ